MNRPTFDHTISILVKAYLNGTLEHGNYCACAVGNLIADAVGAKIVLKNYENAYSKYRWLHPEYTGEEWFCKSSDGKKQIKETGYSFDEIWSIEKVFEHARSWGDDQDEAMFKGLMAVVDVLASIHGVDLSIKEEAKKLFLKV